MLSSYTKSRDYREKIQKFSVAKIFIPARRYLIRHVTHLVILLVVGLFEMEDICAAELQWYVGAVRGLQSSGMSYRQPESFRTLNSSLEIRMRWGTSWVRANLN